MTPTPADYDRILLDWVERMERETGIAIFSIRWRAPGDGLLKYRLTRLRDPWEQPSPL